MYTMKKGYSMTLLPEREALTYPDPTAPVPRAPGDAFFIAGTVMPVRSIDEHRSNVVMADDPEAVQPSYATRLGRRIPVEVEVVRTANTVQRDLSAPTVITLSSKGATAELPPGVIMKPPERRAKTLEEEMGFVPVRQDPGMATIPIAGNDLVESGAGSPGQMDWRSFTWGVAVGAGGTALLGGIFALIYSAVKKG